MKPILRMPMPAMPSVKALDPKLPRKPAFGKQDVRDAVMAKLKGVK